MNTAARHALAAAGDITASWEVFGVFGVVEFAFAKYLIVATERSLAATVQSHKIWRVTKGAAIPIGTSGTTDLIKSGDDETVAKYALDQDLVNSITSIVNSGFLYFSTSYDITHSIQHNHLKSTNSAKATIIDDRYCFNEAMSAPIRALGEAAAPWAFKVICGFAGSIDITADLATSAQGTDLVPRAYTVTLISRLNHRRVGTRYVRRGLDFNGNAANNVEMEQIVFATDFQRHRGISAFVQVRGSLPAVWGQELDLSYRPELLIADINKPLVWGSVKKHYDDLRAQYIAEKSYHEGPDLGKVICVNLLDDTGFEERLTRLYELTVSRAADPKITYEEFPVSKMCRKMNYRNMDILLERMRNRLVGNGWFVAEGAVGAPATPLLVARLQTGLARVSCLDSLDRTNLTCSIFARYILPYQVQAASPDLPVVTVLPLSPPTTSFSAPVTDISDPVAATRTALDPSVRALTNLWADSGDAVSLLYAGTRALKADVTRTGKRQLFKGSFDDGLNSLTRYYLNNFVDGRRQDAYDLWTGKTTSKQLHELAQTAGAQQAKRLRAPFIAKGRGVVGRILPGFIVDRVEPLLQAATEYARPSPPAVADGTTALHLKGKGPSRHMDAHGHPSSVVGLVLSAIKIYAPERVTSALEFLVAMVVFFYILVVARIFKINGQNVVDRPRLSEEYERIHELLD
ncbi:SacI homology domain-containing protein [Blyttiomyces helicus]|uniref:SacI homology domain-containing protein n=1 Tax=Blyttiomyces helicus TaxID=388810 RepID=A0A4V1IRU9_9FUNG|nr:SacI homology domain-containing protein [Blyttiomyces helicus]|eukprot:RKO91317.1 SacI homology domain-containing protein [Blyttiomyces helicus]